MAFVTVGTLSYRSGGSIAPFAAIFSGIMGSHAAVGTALLAVIIIFATANVYTSGMSRVVLSVAKDGGLPKALNYIHPKNGSPTRSLMMLSGLSMCMLIIYYIFDLDLQTALLIPSGAAIIVYIIGSGAGIKLLNDRGAKRVLPWISLAMSVVILPFVGALAFASIAMGAIAYFYALKRTRAMRSPP